MREKFRGYYGLDESETDELWESALIVVDTNVLLGLYGQTPKTRQTMINILEGERDRLWIPHQVALEFQRNKEKSQREATNSHRDLDGLIRSHREKVKNQIEELKKYNVGLDVDVRLRAYERHAGALAQAITRAKRDFAQDLSKGDSVLKTVEDLYPSERVGDPFSPKALSKHRSLGGERFVALVPPGYADAKTKTGDRIYGDYFLWAQLIAHAKRSNQDVIWVTNDQKDDWVDPGTGKFYPALTDEFVAESGQLILLYKSGEFVEEAKRRLVSIQESAEEIEEVAKELDRQGKTDLASWWLRDVKMTSISDIVSESMPKWSAKDFLGEDFNKRIGLTDIVAGLASDTRGVFTSGILDVIKGYSIDNYGVIAAAQRAAALSDEPSGAIARAAVELARQEQEAKDALYRGAVGAASETTKGPGEEDSNLDDEFFETL